MGISQRFILYFSIIFHISSLGIYIFVVQKDRLWNANSILNGLTLQPKTFKFKFKIAWSIYDIINYINLTNVVYCFCFYDCWVHKEKWLICLSNLFLDYTEYWSCICHNKYYWIHYSDLSPSNSSKNYFLFGRKRIIFNDCFTFISFYSLYYWNNYFPILVIF